MVDPMLDLSSPPQVLMASGEQLPILEYIRVPIKLGELELLHEFTIVGNLVAPVILGVHFLHGNGLVSDFTQSHVIVHPAYPSLTVAQILPLYQAECKSQARAHAITALELSGTDVVDECAFPKYGEPQAWNSPNVQYRPLT